jgi:hypothetical protein
LHKPRVCLAGILLLFFFRFLNLGKMMTHAKLSALLAAVVGGGEYETLAVADRGG